MAQVQLSKLIKKYGSLEVVHGINLEIADHEFVVFVGPSGCGKSTTLRMIAGLESISGGEVRIGDKVVNHLPARERNISMVFQNYALYPHMTVAENLGFSLKIGGKSSAEIKSAVDEAAKILSIESLMDRKPAELSGGQRQRVAMGRAIVRQPDVFLFDEPLSNLDAKLRTQMRVEIKKLHQKVASTIVYVTHDQVEAMTLADRIVIMRDGYIEQVGTPFDVFMNPVNTFVASFIGSPPMNFIPAKITKGKIELAGGATLQMPSKYKAEEGADVIFGVRADNIMPEGHAMAINGAIDAVEMDVTLSEPLGTETLIYADYNGHEVLSKMLNPRPVKNGERFKFKIAIDECHVFDANDQRALRIEE